MNDPPGIQQDPTIGATDPATSEMKMSLVDQFELNPGTVEE
jgi:hypothetical protein